MNGESKSLTNGFPKTQRDFLFDCIVFLGDFRVVFPLSLSCVKPQFNFETVKLLESVHESNPVYVLEVRQSVSHDRKHKVLPNVVDLFFLKVIQLENQRTSLSILGILPLRNYVFLKEHNAVNDLLLVVEYDFSGHLRLD